MVTPAQSEVEDARRVTGPAPAGGADHGAALDGLRRGDGQACEKGIGRAEIAAVGDDDVQAPRDLPGKNEMRASLLATLMAPATSLVRTLNAGAQNFAYVLDARKRALESNP